MNLEDLHLKLFGLKPQSIERITPDGSSRKYYRLHCGENTCIGVSNANIKENIAFIDYANQLRSKGINVPKVLISDFENGIYLQEDLGDTTLYSYYLTHCWEDTFSWYEKLVEYLPTIQLVKNFDYQNAYPRQKFDRQSIQWDLNYFKYYFLRLGGIAFNEQDLEEDFSSFIDLLLTTDTSYFLYRDMQARNIMLKDNSLWFIDFQSGRQGALQYDLASLLFDGRMHFTYEQRQQLFDKYFIRLQTLIPMDRTNFVKYFYFYSLVRIMQSMGTYGYRGYFQRKEAFLRSIPLAVKNLEFVLSKIEWPKSLPALNNVFKQIIESKTLLSFAENVDKNQQHNNISKQESEKLTIEIQSFSYKKGYPMDKSGNGGGFVFDCRALPNPGKIERYKNFTGMDECVQRYLSQYKEVDIFLNNIKGLVDQTIKNYLDRHFTHLSISFGCTGGQHRSVYCADYLAKELMQNADLNIVVIHREQKY